MVKGYFEKEMAAGKVVGSTGDGIGARWKDQSILSHFKGPTRELRLILELSSPQGRSVNDGIRKEWCLLVHMSVDDIVKIIRGWG